MQAILNQPKTPNFSLASARKLVKMALDEETLIILKNVSWRNYEQLMDDRQAAGRRSPRFDYSDGTLWIDPKAAPENGVSLSAIEKAVQISISEKSNVILHHVSWKDYENVLAMRDGSHNPRFFYHEERLSIMPTSLEHEAIIYFLELFINFVTVEWRINCTGFRSATFRRDDLREGFEPDSCFYFEANEAKMRGKKRFDGAQDPPPDLIVEVDITSSSEIREETYAAFNVPEIWRFDGEKINILRLENKTYNSSEKSLFLPFVNREKLTDFILEAEKLNRLEWIEKVQEWARKVNN